MIGLPPSELGADHVRATCPFEGVAVLSVGAPGTAFGVADSAFEAGPAPAAFVAVTVNEYEVLLARPVTVQVVVPAVVQVAPPGLAVAV